MLAFGHDRGECSRVAAERGGADEDVFIGTTSERVDCRAADEQIAAGPAHERIRIGLAIENVVVCSAFECVCAESTQQRIVTNSSFEPIVRGVTRQRIVATAADGCFEFGRLTGEDGFHDAIRVGCQSCVAGEFDRHRGRQRAEVQRVDTFVRQLGQSIRGCHCGGGE